MSSATPRVVWATHPRHLPKPPAGRVVVLDVAFAAANQFQSKTKPFIDALGDRLVRYIDHHEHRTAWPLYVDDPRFLLVQNRVAHACPELVTPEVVAAAEASGAIDALVAHCDFDGAVSAMKWITRGKEPWPAADEDARAVDSPGRGHSLSERGTFVSDAMDEASVRYERPQQLDFMSRVVAAYAGPDRGPDPALEDEMQGLARAARAAHDAAQHVAKTHGKHEADGVFVIRVDEKQDNRMRRNLLLYAEEQARIGCVHEPDPQGGAWLTAATFDQSLDLEDVAGFEGGRSDYRFARAHKGGHDLVEALGAYLRARSAATST